MRRLVTGRSCRFLGKIPGFASPPLDGFALFSDRIVTANLAADTPEGTVRQRENPMGRKYRLVLGCIASIQAALPGVSSDDRPMSSAADPRDKAIDARGFENSGSSSSAGSGRAR